MELFEKCGAVLKYYQERFKYIMVDEYQDTNTAQFKFISLLASKYENLCVVGDDDQSIYKFRGANIGNILGFEHVFPDAKVIRLEQNYRSTKNILNAANAVIANNTSRKSKTLWTENSEGERIHFRQFMNGYEEAEYVVGEISRAHRENGAKYKDCAVLYRTNAQSRLFEEKCLLANIPYKIVGGVNFYARKEIKDLLCYLKTIDNSRDDLAVRRIINVPKRGIGATTLGRIQDYADKMSVSFYDALRVAEEVPSIGRSLSKIDGFVTFIQSLKSKAESYTVRELLEEVIELTGYVAELQAEDTDESKARIENIDELISKTESYQEAMEEQGMQTMLHRIPDHINLESVRATWEAGLYLYRTDFPVQPDAKVACWYGEKEGHMKKAIQRLRKAYPGLIVRCFPGFGHGEIINHPALLASELERFLTDGGTERCAKGSGK